MLTTIYSKKAFLWAAFLKNIPKLLLRSCSVVCNPFWPHGLQHARLPGPSLFPGACPNSCPLSLWSHSTISFSVVPFSSCLQSFPASGSFPMSRLFTSGGQSIGASVLPTSIQSWFPLGLTAIQGTLKSLLQHNLKVSIIWLSAFFYSPTLTHTTTGEIIALTTWTFVSKVMSLLFNTLSSLS